MTQVEDGLWSGEGPQQDQTMPGPGSWTSAFTAWINECLPSTPTLPYLWHFVGSPRRQRHVHFTSSPFQGSVTSHRLSLSCFLPNQHPYFFFILCIGHLAHNRHSTTPGSLYWMLLYLNTVQWIHRQADWFLNIPWDFAITFLVMSSSLTLKVTVITHLDSPPSCSLSVKFLFLSCNHFIVCVFLILEIQGIKLELCACQASLYSMLHYYLHKMKYWYV